MATDTIEKEQAVTPITVERHNSEGDVVDTVELDASIFGVTPNVPLMHQVITAQLAARRSGTQSTKTRAEVSGGAAKPYRQKGTGRARQGTIRAPHYAGGGVALGPKPRSYAQRTPRKMIRQALCSALSDRLAEGRLRIVESWPFETPRTKEALGVLEALELDGRVLVVLTPEDGLAERSFGNLSRVQLVEAAQLTAYEVLAADWLLFSTSSVPGGVTVVEGSKPKPKPKRTPAKKAAPTKASETPADDDTADDDTADDEVDTHEVVTDEAAATEPAAAAGDESEGGEVEAAEASVSTPASGSTASPIDDDESDETDETGEDADEDEDA